MSQERDQFAQARQVADAVLYESYLLYPYHQAAQKNRARFQFGVLMPPAYRGVDPSERNFSQTECVVEAAESAQVRVLVRFLQLQRRTVSEIIAPEEGGWREVASLTVDGTVYAAWDEAVEREHEISQPLAALLNGDGAVMVNVPAGTAAQEIVDASGQLAGRIMRTWTDLDGIITLRARLLPGPYGAIRLTLRIENHSSPPKRPKNRNDGLAHAFIAAHALIWIPGGSFLSMTDPPEWAARDVAGCENVGVWPVLAGPAEHTDLVLSSPVILYDHAEVAPESAGDLFDATEIDEILTLRTLALTDMERSAARSTDPRAAGLLDRLDGMPPEMLDRLHGAIRYLRAPGGQAAVPAAAVPAAVVPAQAQASAQVRADQEQVPARVTAGSLPEMPPWSRSEVPWWDPGADASVSPETDQVMVAGVPIARGSLVRMRPGARRADAQDMFLAGREATVEAVVHDVDGNVHIAVSPADDPAADLRQSHGRFLYFSTDEIEPIGPGDGTRRPSA